MTTTPTNSDRLRERLIAAGNQGLVDCRLPKTLGGVELMPRAMVRMMPLIEAEINKLNAEKAETIEGLEGLAEEMFNDGDTHVSYYAEEILNPLLDKLKGGS